MTDIHKAAREAVEAADSSEQLRLIAAVLAAQQLTQQPQQAPAVRPPANVGQWVAIGAAGSVLGIAFALSVLVLRGLWTDYQRDRDQD